MALVINGRFGRIPGCDLRLNLGQDRMTEHQIEHTECFRLIASAQILRVAVNRPGFSRHFRAVGNTAVRTVPEKG